MGGSDGYWSMRERSCAATTMMNRTHVGFSMRPRSRQRTLVGLIRALAGVGGLCLLFCVSGLAVELPHSTDSGGSLTDPSHWRRWLPERSDAGDVSLPVSAALPPLTMATTDPIRQRFTDQALVQKWATGPASLPWNHLALELIVKYQQNPLRAARVLAHLHAAAHDAIVGLAATSSEEAAQAVAVHAAAAGVLAHFYPRESPGRLEAIGIGAMLAVAGNAQMSPQTLDFARASGRHAATVAIRRALDDGGDATWNPADRPPPAPHIWRAAPPLNLANPSEPLAGKWRTWALADGREIQPPPPPLFGSERYWEEAREVLRVARRLSVEQKRIADEWNLDKGSVTPPGVWNRKATEWVAQRALGTAETARVFTALNVAMADALVACWQAKFEYWSVRPVNVIREKLDPDFLPWLFTPPFPSYVSGHAAVSGAAAEVLAAFFPEQAGELRTASDEAAMSRLYGGIHFRSDNEEGLRLGRRVGRRVLERSLGRDRLRAGGEPARPAVQ